MGGCFSCFEGVVPSGVHASAKMVRQQLPTAPAPNPTGRTRALLVGCNYIGTRAELHGCINDVENVCQLLSQTFGWRSDKESMRILVDDGSGDGFPTRQSLLSSLAWLVEGAKAGDTLFFSYSGHGAQEIDPNGFEEDGMNETILPCDFEEAGMISDDTLTDMCVQRLPEGVKLTVLMDCCHSGSGLDLAWTWQSPLAIWREDVNPFHVAADVQMISGCTDDQTSADGAEDLYGRTSGALTTAFCDVACSCISSGIQYSQLLKEMQSHIYMQGFSQNPQLTSSQAFAADTTPFSLTKVNMNANEQLGRIFRHKFSPQPRVMEGPLADMLGELGMLIVQEEIIDSVLGGFSEGSNLIDQDGSGGMNGLLGGMMSMVEDIEDDSF